MYDIVSLQFLKLGAIAAAIFVVIDLIWLGVVASSLYSKELGYLGSI